MSDTNTPEKNDGLPAMRSLALPDRPMLPTPPPTTKKGYTMTFVPLNTAVQVHPQAFPYVRIGKLGSILDIALGHDIHIEHACGGVAACATCHVFVREGLESCQDAADDELDQLDNAPGVSLWSRLACQAVPDGSRDVVVEIPAWNRNLAEERSPAARR
jgi:2Fe-2S ferredoxin